MLQLPIVKKEPASTATNASAQSGGPHPAVNHSAADADASTCKAPIVKAEPSPAIGGVSRPAVSHGIAAHPTAHVSEPARQQTLHPHQRQQPNPLSDPSVPSVRTTSTSNISFRSRYSPGYPLHEGRARYKLDWTCVPRCFSWIGFYQVMHQQQKFPEPLITLVALVGRLAMVGFFFFVQSYSHLALPI